MHCLVPYFTLADDAARHVLREAALAPLAQWLAGARCVAQERIGDDALQSPDERFVQHHLRLAPDGPSARIALARHAAGLGAAGGWGELRLVHWQVGREEIVLHPQLDLRVTPQEHAAIERDIAPLLREDGFALDAQAPGVWHLQGDDLRELVTAAPQRAAGREVRHYAPRGPAARKWRRIEGELQMLLYHHPANAVREAAGALTLNALWLSGTGALPSAPATVDWQTAEAHVPFLLAGQWDEYRAALENSLPQTMLQTVEYLTLCSERAWLTLHAQRRNWWQRLARRGERIDSVLERL